jgi:acylphosphatase
VRTTPTVEESAVNGETVARRLRLRGRVQGVFFRSGVKHEAAERGVAGWAANHPDGSVEIVLEGGAPDVEAVISFCAQGPPGARVSHIEVCECPPRGLTGFDIR